MGPLGINCLNTWRPYCNPLLTNHDTNYNLQRTLLMLLRQCRYLTTTNLCLLMWNHCSPVFHFNLLYRVQRPQSNNLPLNLCLTSTYFQYNGKHYKQLHGTAMGSPISVVAETVMQHTEERALATCRQTISLWLRFLKTLLPPFTKTWNISLAICLSSIL